MWSGNTPGIFQQMLPIVQSEMESFAMTYLGDILMLSVTLKELMDHRKRVRLIKEAWAKIEAAEVSVHERKDGVI